jgi:hypothetical protein
MASITQRTTVDVGAETAWAALRNVAEAHKLFAPVLTDCQLSADTRTVRFANGLVVHERIIDVDDAERRVAYTVLDGPGMTYHHASMRIEHAGSEHCLFVWTTDFLPEAADKVLSSLIEQGTSALKRNLEARTFTPSAVV